MGAFVRYSYCIGAYCFVRLYNDNLYWKKTGVARGDVCNCTRKLIFEEDYHHSRMFSRELETVDNSQKFSFANYSRYTVCLVYFLLFMYGCNISNIHISVVNCFFHGLVGVVGETCAF